MFGFDIQFPVNEELTVAQDFLWKHKLELFTDHFYYQLNTILKKCINISCFAGSLNQL